MQAVEGDDGALRRKRVETTDLVGSAHMHDRATWYCRQSYLYGTSHSTADVCPGTSSFSARSRPPRTGQCLRGFDLIDKVC